LVLVPPVPGEIGVSLDWGTVVGLEGFKFGDGALAAPRPPTLPPDEFPVAPVAAAPPPAPPPVPLPAPPLCANAPATVLNVSTAPSARTTIFRFMIPLLAREKFCAPKRKRAGADLVPALLKLKGRPKPPQLRDESSTVIMRRPKPTRSRPKSDRYGDSPVIVQ
jgi:hypothetical protein